MARSNRRLRRYLRRGDGRTENPGRTFTWKRTHGRKAGAPDRKDRTVRFPRLAFPQEAWDRL